MNASPIPMARTEPKQRSRVDQAGSIDYQVTPSFVALLERLGCSLVITNYQSSTVMTFSSLGDGRPEALLSMHRRGLETCGIDHPKRKIAKPSRAFAAVVW